MSAWPQAAWIVNKLSSKLEFPELANMFAEYINQLDDKVNDFNAEVTNLEQSVKISNSQPGNPFKGLIWIEYQQ